MTLDAFAGRLSPDMPHTLRRFPLPAALAAGATLIVIALSTQSISSNHESWIRVAMGLATAAIFATGGALFRESRPNLRLLGSIAAYVVPVLAFLAWQVTSDVLLVPYALPAVGTLWTSLSTSTTGWRGEARIEAQDRYWWLNHLAVTSGAIVCVALLIIVLGTLAIGQTVEVLFGLNALKPLMEIVLPAIGFFFVPVYWLSTLPRAADHMPGRLEQPDFLVRAVAAIGKFVLIPLLLAYAAILLLYAAQIIVTQQLPEGRLGWMVMAFAIVGAGAFVILYPPFMRSSAIVRFFTRWWWWATIVPLILFFVGLQVRVDAYGLTPERVLLAWGGVWAAAVTGLYLIRRGDIRLVPAIAAAALLLATVGPWNIVNMSRLQQSATFDNLLPLTGEHGESYGIAPSWTPEEEARARSAVDFLVQDQAGQDAVRNILFYKGFELKEGWFQTADVMQSVGVRQVAVESGAGYTLTRDLTEPVNVSATPNFIGDVHIYRERTDIPAVGLSLVVEGTTLTVSRYGESPQEIDLRDRLIPPDKGTLASPSIEFNVDGVTYRLVADRIALMSAPDENGAGGELSYIDGKLFAGSILPAPKSAVVSPTAEGPLAPAT